MIDPSNPPSPGASSTAAHLSPDSPEPARGWRRAAIETAQCLRFYSRLPVPPLSFEADPHAAPDFTRVPRMLPIAGSMIGAVGAAVLLAASLLGLPPVLSAALAVAALALATG